MEKIQNYFYVTELSGGLSYSLKCRIDGTVNQHRRKKTMINAADPALLCSKCSEYGRKQWEKIKRKCVKLNFNPITVKKSFLISGICEAKCPKDHVVIISDVEKFPVCDKCFRAETKKYLTKKCSKKFVENFYYKTLSGYELGLVKVNIECISQGLKILLSDECVIGGEKIFIKNQNFKKFKIGDIASKLGYKTFVENDDEICITATDLESVSVPTAFDDFKKNEEKAVLEKRFGDGVNVDFEIIQKEFLEFVKEREKFVNDYNQNLKNEHSIFNDKFNRENYPVLKSAYSYKNGEFDSVSVEESQNNLEKSSKQPAYENVHFSIDQYMRRILQNDTILQTLNYENLKICDKFPNLVKMYGEKCVKMAIVEPPLIEKISHKAKPENIKLETLTLADDDLEDVVETREEKKIFSEMLKLAIDARKEVNRYHFETDYRSESLLKILKKFKKISEDNFTISDCFIDAAFRIFSNDVDFYIDPVIVVTIALLRGDSSRSPFQTYFSNENPLLVYDETKQIYWKTSKGVYVLPSSRWLQKILYVDSGVSSLFAKIILNGLNFSKHGFDSLPELSRLVLDATPRESFDCNECPKAVGKYTVDRIDGFGFVDVDFDLFDFFNGLYSQNVKSYTRRASMINAFTILYSKGISCRMNDISVISHWEFLYETRKSEILNYSEIAILDSAHEIFAKKIIKSEILNAFKKSIVDPKKCVLLGTIEHPKIFHDKSCEISKQEYMHLCCSLET